MVFSLRTRCVAALFAVTASAASAASAQGSLPAMPSAQTPGVLTPAQEPPAATEAQEIEKLVRAREFDAALKRADALLARSPRNAQVRFLRAVALSETGRSSDAIGALEAMTQEFPELPEPYNNLAVLHAAAGRYDLARTLLLRAIEVAPNYVTAQENLGDLHVAIAADVYARALTLDPTNAALKTKLQTARDTHARLKAAR
ncbi:MAG: tetratricopeptide repeat protein [Burkholderiaceae bacterium]|nr:tetratricopeptide repeat protein [Burkholderiaceae bacterium]